MSWWRVLAKCGPVEKGMENHFSILALRTPGTVWEGKKIWQWKMNSPDHEVPSKVLEKSRKIASERVKRLCQSKNNAQWWMWLVMQVKSGAVKKQYCIGIRNVRSKNQSKLEVVKQEMPRVNIDILGISELKWTRMGKFNSDDHYIYYCGQEFLRRNGVALIVNKRVWNAVLGYNLKMTEWSLFISKAKHSLSQ